MSKVYVLTNDSGVILRIDGGYSTPADLTGWTLIDEGEGDRYNLSQTHYLPLPLTEDGVPRYRLEAGRIVERPAEEMEAERFAAGEMTAPTLEDRIRELENAFETLMTGATDEE